MKSAALALLAAVLTILAGCASFPPATMAPGTPESDIVGRLGQPTARYQDGKDHLLEYAQGPWGQQTYMARIGPDGRLVSYEQVLTTQKFGTLEVGKSTKEDVLRTVGGPSDTSYLTLSELEVWSYPYKESNVWNSIMHIHFDKNGIVRKMVNGPDPRFDPDLRFPLGILAR